MASRPGILLNSTFLQKDELTLAIKRVFDEKCIKCIIDYNSSIKQKPISVSKRKKEKQIVYLVHSICIKDEIVLFNNQIFKVTQVPTNFEVKEKDSAKKYFSIYT